MSQPASIRYYNPGAMYPGPSAARYGSRRHEVIGGGHKIAVFDDPISGAAAQFYLLASPTYAGKPLAEIVRTWSGGNANDAYTAFLARAVGVAPGTAITRGMLADPKFAIPFAKAAAQWEAGQPYPLTDEQWAQAHARAFGGGAAPMPLVPEDDRDTSGYANRPDMPAAPAAAPAVAAAQPFGSLAPEPEQEQRRERKRLDMRSILDGPLLPPQLVRARAGAMLARTFGALGA